MDAALRFIPPTARLPARCTFTYGPAVLGRPRALRSSRSGPRLYVRGPGLPTHPARPSRVPDPRRFQFGPQGCSRSVRIARVSSRAPNVFTAVILNSLCDNPTSVPHLPDAEAGFCFPRLSVLCDSLLKAGHGRVTHPGANWLFVEGLGRPGGGPNVPEDPDAPAPCFVSPLTVRFPKSSSETVYGHPRLLG